MARHRLVQLFTLLITVLTLSACTGMVTSKLGDNLAEAIINQDDPDTVRAGAPAYLLLIDGLISGNPKDSRLLVAGARLYSSYAAVFVENPERAKRMANKARGYAERALCMDRPGICELAKGPYLELLPEIQSVPYEDLSQLYAYALSWALWIQTHSSDWSAIADLPKVEAMLERVIELNNHYELPVLRPKPENRRQWF